MKKIKFLCSISLLLFGPALANAQVDEPLRQSSAAKPIPLPSIREADVFYLKRTWEVIDLREKFNLPLYFPEAPLKDRISLFDLIKRSVLSGTVTAYSPGFTQDDQFQNPMTLTEVQNILVSTTEQQIEDLLGNITTVPVTNEVKSTDVFKFRLKEEWFFDKQRSVFDVRIIGIAPIKDEYVNGIYKGERILFWVYFPELRPALAQTPVYNPHNDADELTYDQLFIKRKFHATIVKQSNVYDRNINEYMTGIDAMLEAEFLKEQMRNFEHDLWEH